MFASLAFFIQLLSWLICYLVWLDWEVFRRICNNEAMIKKEIAIIVDVTSNHLISESWTLVHLCIQKRRKLVAIPSKPYLFIVSDIERITWRNLTSFPLLYLAPQLLCFLNLIKKSYVHLSGAVVFALANVVCSLVISLYDTRFMSRRVIELWISVRHKNICSERDVEGNWLLLTKLVGPSFLYWNRWWLRPGSVNIDFSRIHWLADRCTHIRILLCVLSWWSIAHLKRRYISSHLSLSQVMDEMPHQFVWLSFYTLDALTSQLSL